MMTGLRRFVTWLFRSDYYAGVCPTEAAEPASALDPVVRGNHWQNLLSSPMDARHYVMEDWSL